MICVRVTPHTWFVPHTWYVVTLISFVCIAIHICPDKIGCRISRIVTFHRNDADGRRLLLTHPMLCRCWDLLAFRWISYARSWMANGAGAGGAGTAHAGTDVLTAYRSSRTSNVPLGACFDSLLLLLAVTSPALGYAEFVSARRFSRAYLMIGRWCDADASW